MSTRSLVRALSSSALALVMIGCSDPGRNGDPAVDPGGHDARSSESSPPRDRPATERTGTILFVGTSLTAGLGVSPAQAYPAVLQQKIDSAGLPFRVVNAGVSGETSAGALRRIDWLLRQPVDVLVLETGANDMLRGTDIDSTASNIQAIIDRIRATRPDARIVLAGMLAPPNLGAPYTRRFGDIFPELARRNGIALVPFLLENVGGVASLNQPDGIHPTPEGQRVLAENVWPVLEAELRATIQERRGSPP